MATKKYKYRGYDAKTVKDKANESTGSFDHYLKDGVPRYKMTDGDNNGRILPAQDAWNDDAKMVKKWGGIWYITVWVHTFIGPDNSNFLCRKKMLKEPCAICDARADLTEDDEKLAKKLKPQARALAWWIDRDDEKAGPQVISMPMTKVAQELAARQINKKTGELLAIDHPEDGYDVTFEKSGAGLKTQYTGVDIERKSSALNDNEKTAAKWLDYIMENPLPELLLYHDNDYMEETYMGQRARKEEDEDGDDDDDDRKSKRRRSKDSDDDDDDKKSSKKKRSRDDDGEDDDDDDKSSKKKKRRQDDDDDRDSGDDDDDDDDDKKSSKKKRSRDEDEGDDGDDDGDDDDDDKNSRKKKKSKSSDDDDGDDDDQKSSKHKSRRDNDDDDDGDSGGEDDDDGDDDGDDDDDPPSKGKRRASKDDDDDDDDKSSKARKSIDRVKKRHNRD